MGEIYTLMNALTFRRDTLFVASTVSSVLQRCLCRCDIFCPVPSKNKRIRWVDLSIAVYHLDSFRPGAGEVYEAQILSSHAWSTHRQEVAFGRANKGKSLCSPCMCRAPPQLRSVGFESSLMCSLQVVCLVYSVWFLSSRLTQSHQFYFVSRSRKKVKQDVDGMDSKWVCHALCSVNASVVDVWRPTC